MSGVTIIGTGRHVPGAPVPNDALARVMDTSDEWIQTRTGIKQRYFARDGQGVSDLGVEAAKMALDDAGIEASDIDYIIFATMTPDYFFPGSGPLLGAKLGIPGVPALDIRQQCAAMPYAFQLANGLVQSHAAETILLVGADVHAGFMPWTDWDIVRSEAEREVARDAYERATKHRGLAIIFGDGAAAMVLRDSQTPDGGFIGAELHSDGNSFDHLFVPGCGFRSIPYVTPEALLADEHIPHMLGPSLLKKAVRTLSKTVRSLCETHGVSQDDIDCFIAHQANERINQAVRQALHIPPEKIPSNIARYGNTSAATIGILTDELRRDGNIREGDLLCFLALGAGLNWGAALLRL
ncbi:MAG: 3-oxoacyl-ACP synthase [Deltaproteobacteria bacterium]|nr:3-oxoacyl-ACP synthase [Deltaproteobacteria bacterium]MBW1875219.1 3-oxoacyl-ACP synthase [Deltaproteobacteria bacterium]MBW2212291.1 3-oxoacyl-ACP synthase [Deltaproteobacteria bacterium]MBW2214982.1 3-oxoacyl-ACP synthase [Deltaproteobacteria bacterium]MBW2380834.1 3-oxoacyl-ACP synthase [Deltaproteobacteria bacterium]